MLPPGWDYSALTVSQQLLYTMIELAVPAPPHSVGVAALNWTNGSVLWRSAPIGQLWHDAPIVVKGVVYAYALGGGLYTFRASDGKPLWHYSSAFISTVVLGS
jgi:outer membrane protein assembly factor BamB